MDLRKLGRGFLEASEERRPNRHRAEFEKGSLPRHIGQAGRPRPARPSSQSKPSSPPAHVPDDDLSPVIAVPTEPTMQPSEYEIQQEVEALRDIRRRSTAGGPGSLILDPDLPSPAAAGANPAYWSPTDDSSSSSHEDSSDSSHVSAQDDPFHLFWVPASLHPEIAPAEFRAFLKEHARADDAGAGQLGRTASLSSSGSLSRKKSMLSRQYKPSANDGIEDDEKVVPIRRNRTSVFGHVGPQLTINDLQKLEELAEEASQSDDPSKLRSVLRRSLSLNVAPSVIDQMDMPDVGEDADAPIIVPRPGSILRRAARTKIRKPGQTGEGAHRFTATRSRRKSIGRAATMDEPRSSSDLSSSDHGDGEPFSRRNVTEIPEIPPLPRQTRPESYSEEASIYDAYVTDEPGEIDAPPGLSPISEPGHDEPEPSRAVIPPEPEPMPEPVSVAPPVLHQPQPQRAVSPPSVAQPTPERNASPDSFASPRSSTSTPPRPSLQATQPYAPPSPTSDRKDKDKDKDKKGLFGWKSDKGGKKGGKESREKDSGFFGSLFGGKKKQEEAPPSMTRENGREAAVALLGASKSSKHYVPPPSPQLAGQYARYPIHVERAIYRLSHIKLANPRRPLYEQVLISNLMFWYLGVINKQQSTPTTPTSANGNAQAASQPELDEAQRVEKEREDQERAEKERQEQLDRERAEQQRKEASRRGTLTKAAPPGSPGGRRAEMPVRSPQYDMQHRAMEQEYGYGAPGASMGRTSPGPAANGQMSGYPGSSQSRTSSNAPAPYGSPLASPTPQAQNNRYYPDMSQGHQPYPSVVTPTPQLPPGAMSPAAVEQAWQSVAQSAPMPRHSPPSTPARTASPPRAASPRRARSPPPSNNRYTPAQEKQPYSGQRLPSRSMSASAAPAVPVVPQMNGKLRKNISAHATAPRQASEDEDMPLAMWQQQRRK